MTTADTPSLPGYSWIGSNLRYYTTWEEEVAAAKAEGLELIPAEDYPTADNTYARYETGFQEWKGNLGRRAGEMGYPLYRQPGTNDRPSPEKALREIERLLLRIRQRNQGGYYGDHVDMEACLHLAQDALGRPRAKVRYKENQP